MKILFIGSRLYDDIDWYVKEKGIESVLTESNEEAVNLDLPDQVFIVPRGMDGPKQVALMQNVDAIVPLIGIDPPLIDVAYMKEEVENEYGIPVVAAGVRAVELTSNKIKTKEFYSEINVATPNYQILNRVKDRAEKTLRLQIQSKTLMSTLTSSTRHFAKSLLKGLKYQLKYLDLTVNMLHCLQFIRAKLQLKGHIL